MDKAQIAALFDKQALQNKKPAFYHTLLARFYTFCIPQGKKVLEIGCGCGNLLAAVKPVYGVGIDVSAGMIKKAKEKHPALSFIVADAHDYELSEKFDYIILSDLFGYLQDVQAVLERIQRNAHQNTRIIINYYSFLWEQPLKLAELLGLKRKTGLQNWLSMSDIENLVDLAGLDMIKTGRAVLFPFNIPVISTFFNKYVAHLPIFEQACLVNYGVCRVRPTPQDYSVSIIVPARNEAGNIEAAITRLPQFGSRQEIVFIEGNSTDNTWAEIQRVAEKYKGQKNILTAQQTGKGKGDAVRKGFDIATGDILMILDADLTMPPEDLPKYYKALASGKGEFINGCRLVYPMEKEAMRFLNLLGNKFFSLAFTWLLGQRFKDTLCGTKVLHRDHYQIIKENRAYFGDFDPFGDFDLIFGAAKQNLKIVEIPIHYKDRTYGETNISRFKHGWLLLQMVAFASRKIKFI